MEDNINKNTYNNNTYRLVDWKMAVDILIRVARGGWE